MMHKNRKRGRPKKEKTGLISKSTEDTLVVDTNKRLEVRTKLHLFFIESVRKLNKEERLSYESISHIMAQRDCILDQSYLQKLVTGGRGKEAPPEDVSLMRLKSLGISDEEIVGAVDPDQVNYLIQFMSQHTSEYDTFTEALREQGDAKEVILAAIRTARKILDSKK